MRDTEISQIAPNGNLVVIGNDVSLELDAALKKIPGGHGRLDEPGLGMLGFRPIILECKSVMLT